MVATGAPSRLRLPVHSDFHGGRGSFFGPASIGRRASSDVVCGPQTDVRGSGLLQCKSSVERHPATAA